MPDFASIVHEQLAELIEVAPHCILHTASGHKMMLMLLQVWERVPILAGCRHMLLWGTDVQQVQKN